MAKRQTALQQVPHDAPAAVIPATPAPAVTFQVNINVGDNSVLQLGNNNTISNGTGVSASTGSETALEAARVEIIRRVLSLNLPDETTVRVLKALCC